MWSVWDKTSDVNGYTASKILDTFKHLQGEDTIYIKTVDGRVTQVEGKGVLASVYGIDPALPDEEFLAEYERILAELSEPAPAEETNNAEE